MMKQKFRRGALRRWLTGLLCTGLLCQAVAVPAFAQTRLAEALTEGTPQAEEMLEAENGWSLSDLRAQFPEGRYWNHIGLSGNDPMATTSTPCTSHGSQGYNSSTCNHPTWCNHYGCWGYAEQLGYLYSGSNPSGWTKLEGNSAYNYIDQLKTGDIIRFTAGSDGHSVLVTSVEGETVRYTDCNWNGKCDISWSHTKSKSDLRGRYRVKWIQVCPGNLRNNPVGSVDSYGADAGSVWVNGWAFDRDDLNDTPDIWLFIDGKHCFQMSGKCQRGTYRPDVNNAYPGVGNYHGFSMRYVTDMVGVHTIEVKALNIGDGNAVVIGKGTVNIPKDTEPPVISDVKVTNVTSSGYDVSCTVTDNVGVNRVLFPTWTANNDQDDLLWKQGSRSGNTWTFHVSIADHNNERGMYFTHIYAYDDAENSSNVSAEAITVPEPDNESPTLSDWKIYNITSEGFDVSMTSTDNVGVDRVIVKARTNDNDAVETRADRNGDTYTAHISIHDHGGVRGTYYVNVRSYDASGNYTYFITDQQVIVPEPSTDLVFNANGGTAEFETKPVEQGAAYGALPEAWMDGYVFDGWFTEQTGGDRVSSATIREKADGITLYAHWIPVAADPDKGWALQNGTLVISVQGAMQDYTSARETPWFKDRADIRRIVVQNGVTTIGDYAFYGCENVTSVSLPGTLTQIGRLSFYGCSSLAQIDVPASVTMLEDYAFARAVGLKKITFHGSAPVMGAGLFADVKAEARYPSSDASWTSDVKRNYTGILDWSGVSVSELSLQDDSLQLEDPELEALLLDSTV